MKAGRYGSHEVTLTMHGIPQQVSSNSIFDSNHSAVAARCTRLPDSCIYKNSKAHQRSDSGRDALEVYPSSSSDLFRGHWAIRVDDLKHPALQGGGVDLQCLV